MKPKTLVILSTLALALNVMALDRNTFSSSTPPNSDKAA
jgi:hypothetical protein